MAVEVMLMLRLLSIKEILFELFKNIHIKNNV